MLNNAQTHQTASTMAAAGLLWLEQQSVRERWNLSQDDMATLLGGMSKRTISNWLAKARSHHQVDVPGDTLERLSLLLGIDKSLALTAPAGHRYEFFSRPNQATLFEGESIKEYLLKRQTMLALYRVRRYLDARRG